MCIAACIYARTIFKKYAHIYTHKSVKLYIYIYIYMHTHHAFKYFLFFLSPLLLAGNVLIFVNDEDSLAEMA